MTELFRVSFSILDPWAQGNYDEAVKRYLRLPTLTTPAMEQGKLLHETWQLETMKTGNLPQIFGEAVCNTPECELKLEVVIDDWIQFVGVVDLYEGRTIHEYKTGHASATQYARSMQPRCYQVLVEGHGYQPECALIHHFNQHNNQVSRAKIWLTDNTREAATEWIRTYASELHEALEQTGNL